MKKGMSKIMTEMKRNKNRTRVSENNSSDNDSYKPADTSNERSVASLEYTVRQTEQACICVRQGVSLMSA
ncbi:uncharacterized protein BO88DRAFT_163300 [Aspergillus vadensis CBS 113365]|uniref:Uncharacterized protein n=1 Tax=Aspergillus vadensis (strain CBS 113365 / IMI 142717 / IBT 24658) TaxID=1448311 RepID=A0A319BIF3_ASPVC|nr:hypothetical protein BO88DRAFT_163300 [Aspergillus vadensis CBS 113365]PYH72515.1 hypothetical protein BO88DRAFT_163300 [Aspergillus vadensis CBS 113365]